MKNLLALILCLQSTYVLSQSNIVGSRPTPETGGRIFLYNTPCPSPLLNQNGSFPYKWESKLQDGNGSVQWTGCYRVDQQTQQIVSSNPDGIIGYEPISKYLGGSAGNSVGSFFQSLNEGLRSATTYWNESAAQTQRNTTNLTPGMTGGNRMNCTPDGRGGYNCR